MRKLGLDFDGVISNTNEIKIKLIEEMYGVKLSFDTINEETAMSLGLITHDQYQNAAIRLYNTESSLESSPVSGAIESISVLKRQYDVSIVTSRTEKSVELVKKWCANNQLGNIPVVGTNRQPKTTYLEGYYAFVDDDIKKLIPLVGVVEKLFLYSWPYNANVSVDKGIQRVGSWQELLKSLDSE